MTIYSRKIELEEYLEGLKLLIYSKKEQLVNYTMTIGGGWVTFFSRAHRKPSKAQACASVS